MITAFKFEPAHHFLGSPKFNQWTFKQLKTKPLTRHHLF